MGVVEMSVGRNLIYAFLVLSLISISVLIVIVLNMFGAGLIDVNTFLTAMGSVVIPIIQICLSFNQTRHTGGSGLLEKEIIKTENDILKLVKSGRAVGAMGMWTQEYMSLQDKVRELHKALKTTRNKGA
jgi:hypothetical protein